MGLFEEFRDFAMRGNVIDLAVGVIIGAAFGKIVTSLVEDVLMPPIGKLVGGLDFSNLYISLSDQIDAANARLAAARAATQPAAEGVAAAAESVLAVFDTAARLPLAEARKLGPVIAYGNFITVAINFLIVAFCIFIVIKLMNAAKKRFEKEQAAAPAAAPSAEVQLLGEIRDLLKEKR
ncbi:MAG: large conductance mechanosensitive channel protein MscL [Phycisphaerae bacterium]|nr:large conductance mechanosensitive channel protein MscL [Phycisphaerae bacterium]